MTRNDAESPSPVSAGEREQGRRESAIEEREADSHLMDRALGERASAMEERAAALDAREAHNVELRSVNEKLVIATLAAQELRDEAQAARHQQDGFLAGLRRELSEARKPVDGEHGIALIEANGQLVLAALNAGAAAETASGELEELTKSSQRDPLTGTPNRALMLDRLQGGISLARRRGTRVALLFLDLDGFKQINDTLGHAVGDEVLRTVADRLGSVLRASDTVSRHGGDEFLVLLAEVGHASDAALAATKLLSAVAQAGSAVRPSHPLSASIGIAIYPEDGAEPAALIAQADAAMYLAKQRGGGCFTFHRDA
ncbi:MAG: GGDEF domain-containing protein [Caldimonas sp.]